MANDFLGVGWDFNFLRAPMGPPAEPPGAAAEMAWYEESIRQSIWIILSTGRGERVMRPDFGCGIHDLVFEVIDVAALTRVETAVRDALTRYEARIEVSKVNADPLQAADGLLLIELEYRVRRTNQIGNLVFPFYFRESGMGIVEGSRG